MRVTRKSCLEFRTEAEANGEFGRWKTMMGESFWVYRKERYENRLALK